MDAEPSTYNIDPALIAGAITPRTAAIVPVHLRGEPADMDAIGRLAEDRDLCVIEDAAQAHGARVGGRRVGSLGMAGAFSFYPSKNLGALGDGGAVVTDDDGIAEQVRLLRNYGMRNRYEIEVAGVNSRLSELQAAVLSAKLPRLDDWNRARAGIAELYSSRFEDSDGIELPKTPAWAEPVWHLFVVGCEDRDARAVSLAERGIDTLVHYPVLPHLSEPYAEEWAPGSFPVAERLSESALSLPIYPQLEPVACETVADALIAASEEA